jgi:hypothetical protein
MQTEESKGVTYLIPESAEDVSQAMLDLAEETFDGWFSDDERIDWEEFIDRLCKYSHHTDSPFDFNEYENGAINKIKRHVRNYRNQ